ncbi:MAG: hypothetical protein H0V29_03875 [Thermoleophilaceae bacterium]|nr:hypothetical protein [Thermoleophilaceae bacterium]
MSLDEPRLRLAQRDYQPPDYQVDKPIVAALFVVALTCGMTGFTIGLLVGLTAN